MTKNELTYTWAAKTVLLAQKRPMRIAEIVSVAQDSGYFSKRMFSGTPQKSMQARLSMDILLKGEDSEFIRVGPGQFYLRSLNDEAQGNLDGSRGIYEPYTAPRRRPAIPKENVLVIPKKWCDTMLDFQGFRGDDGTLFSSIISGHSEYLARTKAEESADFKQPIAYVLITHGNKVLSYRRGTFNRAAAFLKGSHCIGFGGHVSEADLSLMSYRDAGVLEGALREVEEELSLPKGINRLHPEDLKFRGLINDDSSEVGRRHFGVVLQYEVKDWGLWQGVEKGESSINQLAWIDADSQDQNLADFEYWSQLCWRSLFPKVAASQPGYKILRKKPFRGQHILVVAGGIGSGKSFVTDFLVKNYAYQEVNSGRVLADILGAPPVPHTPREEFQKIAWEFISSEDGPEQLASALLKKAKNIGDGNVIIDGLRQRETLAILKQKCDLDVPILYVHATPDVALEFFLQREQEGSKTFSPQEFMNAYSAQVEREIVHFLHEADAVVYNWSGRENLDTVLSQLGAKLNLARSDIQ